MGAVSEVGWGPAALVDVIRDQLGDDDGSTTDPGQCARRLAAAQRPDERAERFVDLGGCHFLAGNVSGALAAWRQASVSGQPAAAARALYNLGLFHEEVGLAELAVEQYLAAQSHRVDPYDALAAMATARARLAAGDHAMALEALASTAEQLTERDPTSPLLGQALIGSGDVAEHMRDFDRAARAYRAALGVADETIRSSAGLSLIRVLRFVGRDDEAQQVVDEVALFDVDPAAAVDRVELLVRLNRVEEAAAAIDGVDSAGLSVPDRFRLVSTLLEVGLVNRAIDDLEALSHAEAPETRTRAVYLLGEVYLAHHMYDPARTMLESVIGIQRGYWSDKAALALGDLAFALDDVRGAAAHWADAAASSVESVAAGARHRLVDALEGAEAALHAGHAAAAPFDVADSASQASSEMVISDGAHGGQSVADQRDQAPGPSETFDMPERPDGEVVAKGEAASVHEPVAPAVVPPVASAQRVTLRRRDRPADGERAQAHPSPMVAAPRWREDLAAADVEAMDVPYSGLVDEPHDEPAAHIVSLPLHSAGDTDATVTTPAARAERPSNGAFSKFT